MVTDSLISLKIIRSAGAMRLANSPHPLASGSCRRCSRGSRWPLDEPIVTTKGPYETPIAKTRYTSPFFSVCMLRHAH